MKKSFTAVLMLILTPLCLFALEDNSRSIESLTARIQRYSVLPDLHFQRAKLFMENKDYAAAASDIDKAIVLDPNMQGPKLLQAKLYLGQHKMEEAIVSLQLFIKSSTDKDLLKEANFILGEVFVLKEQYVEAADHYEKMKHKDIFLNQDYYVKLSDVYYRLGDYKKSIKLLKDAIGSFIEQGTLKKKIVELSIEEANYTLALSMLNTISKKDISSARLHYLRARILKEQGNIGEMKEEIQRARFAMKKESKESQENRDIEKKINNLYASL
jgi:tetratricopeptide (TPR) repeat protein